MKIIPKQVLMDIDGTPIKNGEEKMTVGFAITFAINQSKNLNPLLAYKVMLQTQKEKEFDLNVDQTKQIKDEITEFAKSDRRYFGNNVWGQILAILEGEKIGAEQLETAEKSTDKPKEKKSK